MTGIAAVPLDSKTTLECVAVMAAGPAAARPVGCLLRAGIQLCRRGRGRASDQPRSAPNSNEFDTFIEARRKLYMYMYGSVVWVIWPTPVPRA
jgi:hypothetical protein